MVIIKVADHLAKQGALSSGISSHGTAAALVILEYSAFINRKAKKWSIANYYDINMMTNMNLSKPNCCVWGSVCCVCCLAPVFSSPEQMNASDYIICKITDHNLLHCNSELIWLICRSWPHVLPELTHWGLNKMAAILQTFSNASS